ncbi:MAG: cytochrome c biogenesis protein/redoxin [Pseudomonadota bacterium]
MSLLTIYVSGVLSFFSPCLLPIIPVYFSVFTGENGDSQMSGGKLILKGLLFCLGFTAVFTLLGLGAGGLSSNILSNKPAINMIAGVIILLLALKFIGLINIPLLDRTYSISLKGVRGKFGLLSAFVIGVLFAATWSPCIGAVLGSILTYVSSTSASTLSGGVKLFMFGAGVSTPLIISTFFYKKLLNFSRNNMYLLVALQKILGLILIIFSFSLFSQGLRYASYSKAEPLQKNKLMMPTNLPLVVSFVSEDCEECKEMVPVMGKLIDSCGDKLVEFRTINMDDIQFYSLIYELEVFGSPTYIFISRKGEEKQRLIGINDIKIMDNEIEKLTGNSCLRYSVHP